MTVQEASELIEKMYLEDQESWKHDIDDSKLILENTERIKEIITAFGCITISKFTEKISHYAWLLVQHANHDIQFQEYYLDLMIKSNDVLKRDIAYLSDRIAILKGEPQTWGTQFDPKTLATKYAPYPIKDLESVDERRREVGLGTMEEYTEAMYEKYKDKVNR